MSIMHRGEFEKAVAERFPQGRRTRKETGHGWVDTIAVGFLRVTLEVCDVRRKSRRKADVSYGHLRAKVEAVREDLDGSLVVIWQKDAPDDEALALLDDLRSRLLGVAHGLIHISGREGAPPREFQHESKPVDWDALLG